MSLGDKYRPYFDHATTQVNESAAKLNLATLQKGAVDWARSHHVIGEEAKPTQIALSATEGSNKGTTTNNNINSSHPQWAQRPCLVCSHRGHAANACFDEGGGLAHLSEQEKNDLLEMKRKRREVRWGRRTSRRPTRGDEANQAMMAQQILKLEHQQKLSKIEARLQEHGLESDFTDLLSKE